MFALSKKLIILAAMGGLVLVAIILLTVFLTKGNSVENNPLLIATPNGLVRGKHVVNETTNATFWAWEGIPFAQPPIGNLRFQAPLPAKPWNGILEANHSGTPCIPTIQFILDANPAITGEDCLYLNIYAPAKKYDKKLPVMFYILGGGFQSGAAIYDAFGPDDLVENEVIVITFGHRVGMLGFLSTGDESVPGNAALKDQLLALKWTNDNIDYFGGDSRLITIFGGSSGGMSVGFHYWNKNSAGLFRAAICQSGCSLTLQLFQENPRANAFELGKLIDPTISAELNSTEELREFLQSVDVNLLVEANKNISVQTGFVIEVEHEGGFITTSHFEARALLEAGKFNQVPLLLGDNSEESLTWCGKSAEEIAAFGKTYDDNITRLIPDSLNPANSTNLTELALTIKETYVGNGSFESNIVELLEFYSDNRFTRNILRQAQLVSKYQPAVYLYQFSYYGTVSVLRGTAVIEGAGKVGHAAEYPQIFKAAVYPLTLKEDILISKRFARLWTNFAKYLNPTPNSSDPLLDNVVWPPVTPEKIQYLDIDSVLTVKQNRKVKEMAMWDELFQNYSQPPYQGY